MDFEQLKQLVVIHECGSISAAARKLHMTQSTLSRQMTRLEENLGVALFDRTRNTAQLSPLGMLAVTYAEEACTLEARMRDGLLTARRQLVLAGTHEAGLAYVRDAALDRFPDTLFSQINLADDVIEVALREGDAALGITAHPLVAPDIMALPLPAPATGAYVHCTTTAPPRAREVFSWIEG